jgi:molybdenum cofactor guanylyltransferase
MTGLVLCGGGSRRMGSDKGLLEGPGGNWARTAYDKIRGLGIACYLSVNPSQVQAYSRHFDPDLLIPDLPDLPIKGPLLGLLSAANRFPEEDILALACDMPKMQGWLLAALRAACLQAPDHDAWVYYNQGQPEPLCSIYAPSSREIIWSLFQEGKLEKFSMKFLLDHVRIFLLPISQENLPFFENINSHAASNGQ